MKKIAINGFGRIGRLAFREMITSKDLNVIAINDLATAEELAYLLKYDTNHRSFHENEIGFEGDCLVIAGTKKIKVYSEKDPINLPWKELGIDAVLECSGHFTKYEDAYKHIEAGAKKVVISAPGKGDMKTIVYNVNHDILDCSEQIISAASCTTNCMAPVVSVIEKNIGIVGGSMSTIHAYTNDQATLDITHSKGIYARRGRACAANIVPASTGAASAIGKVIPSLDGKIVGKAFRVPVSDGSMIDLTLELKKSVTKEELNNLFIENQNETLKVTNDPVVSSDCIGKKCGAIVDLLSTDVINFADTCLAKVVAWYDNEMGYTHQMISTLRYLLSLEK